MSFGQSLLAVVAALAAAYFFIIWLPHRMHIRKIARKYGGLPEKQAAIKKLFREGKLTTVGYTSVSNGSREEFQLLIQGPFGIFVRAGSRDPLTTQPGSPTLPPEVAEAFEGYIDEASDVIWLLWDFPFLEDLKKEGKGKFHVTGDMPGTLVISSG